MAGVKSWEAGLAPKEPVRPAFPRALWPLRHLLDPRDEVLGVAEARRRQADVLFVDQLQASSDALVDLLRHGIVAHRERKLLRHGPGQRHQRHLALPGLADPPLLGELLYIAGALTLRVAPV